METDAGDTAHYDPRLRGLIHYKRRRYFLLNAMQDGAHGIAEYSTGAQARLRRRRASDPPRRRPARPEPDRARRRRLGLRGPARPPASGEQEFWVWLIAGTRYQDVAAEQLFLLGGGPDAVFKNSRAVSRTAPPGIRAARGARARGRRALPPQPARDRHAVRLRRRDHRRERHDIMRFARDTYSYVWPRDGALVARALDLAGHHGTARRFFSFCVEHVSARGYFFQKYNADGSLASSWHPWVRDGKEQIPIQEDETALVLWALAAHLARAPRRRSSSCPSYSRLVRRAADFLYEFRDPRPGCPLPSWDLWEERFGVHAFTVASVHAGLSAPRASRRSSARTPPPRATARAPRRSAPGSSASSTTRTSGRYVRMGTRENGGYWHDVTIDSALCGLFLFDLLPLDDERLVRTMKAVEERLWVDTDVGGVARYENDYYHQVSKDIDRDPGQPLVRLHALARRVARAPRADGGGPRRRPSATSSGRPHARPSGVMAEQVHPDTGEPRLGLAAHVEPRGPTSPPRWRSRGR